MPYFWEIIEYSINYTQTWTEITQCLFWVMALSLSILWISNNKALFKRVSTAVTISSLSMFGIYSFEQANILWGSNTQIANNLRTHTFYYDVAEVISVDSNVFGPGRMTIRRKGNLHGETVLFYSAGFGLGTKTFAPMVKEYVPEFDTLYDTESQEQTDLRRALEGRMAIGVYEKNIPVQEYEAISFELMLEDEM